MNVRFLATAREELDNAVAWYDQQADGLGKEFLDEFDRVIRRVVSYPLSAVEIDPGLRRGLLARFPYGLIYGQDGDTVVIVAVAHLHREPRYWVDRLK
ncbi:MAG: plasmid stabilization protein [Nitrospirae bacterium GWC1_57_7]|nr:MAG: plasmid stabilization protein [Nitrospirae bacterium GWC1_57_7]OGW40670.1 MAG: plasmid stabilization protein [Nitrospirae bacterium GWD2_57_8]HAR46537.1 plasmid stabilization protein [Nitrospiraceae bacterium]